MTKIREPLTFHHALTKVAALIGYDECGAVCGVLERAVRSWSDPDDAREISLNDALRLDRAFLGAGGDHGPFHRVYSLRLDIAAREKESADLLRAAGLAAKEGGEAVSAMLQAAQNPGDRVARRNARREGEEAAAAIADGLAALDRIEAAEAGG